MLHSCDIHTHTVLDGKYCSVVRSGHVYTKTNPQNAPLKASPKMFLLAIVFTRSHEAVTLWAASLI